MREHVITMTERPGHFEQGRWVEEPDLKSPAQDPAMIEQRLAGATKSVIAALNDMAGVTRDLVATPEGKQYMEKTIADTRAEVEKSVDLMMRQFRQALDKRVKR